MVEYKLTVIYFVLEFILFQLFLKPAFHQEFTKGALVHRYLIYIAQSVLLALINRGLMTETLGVGTFRLRVVINYASNKALLLYAVKIVHLFLFVEKTASFGISVRLINRTLSNMHISSYHKWKKCYEKDAAMHEIIGRAIQIQIIKHLINPLTGCYRKVQKYQNYH